MRKCAFLLVLATSCFAVDLSLVWIGDPHLNQQGAPFTTWANQTDWIVANKTAYNIQAVLCAGDIWWDYLADSWNYNGKGLSVIDSSGLPYLVTVGNHDFEGQNPAGRKTTAFDSLVGYSRISAKSWYIDYWHDSSGGKATQAIKFDVGNRHILVISLEFFPRPAAVAWAGSVINANPTYEVVIITHGYMTTTGSLIVFNDPNGLGPASYNLPADNYSGVAIEAWAKTFPNVDAILCGHYASGTPYQNHRTDTATDGHQLDGIFADYQSASPPSQVVLLLELSGAQVNVRAFNTTTGVEETANLPYVLQWGKNGTSSIGLSRKSMSFDAHIESGAILKYTLPKEGFVSLKIFDIRGKMMIERPNNWQSAGSYSLPLSTARLSQGAYLMSFNAGSFTVRQKFSILR